MAILQKKFIELTNVMDPETSRFGNSPSLALNVIPTNNGFRAIEEIEKRGNRLIGFWPHTFNSAFQHIFLADTSVQKSRAVSDVAGSKSLVRLHNLNDDTDLYTTVDEEVPSVEDFFVSGGASSGATAKFNIVDYDTPSGTSNWKFRVAYMVDGNSGGTANIAWTLYANDGTTVLDGPTNVYNSASDTDGWKVFEDSFTGNLSWDTDPVVGFSLTTFGDNQIVVPTDEVNNESWLDETGDSVNAGESIDEGSTPNDSDYIVSPALGLSGSTKYKAKFVAEDPLARRSSALTGAVNVRWKKPQVGGTLSVSLLQGTTDPVTIATWAIGTSAAQASYTTTALDLTAAEFNAITDFSDLWLEWTFTAGTGSYVYDELDPIDTESNTGSWVDHDEDDEDIHLDCDEGSDAGDVTTFIQPDPGLGLSGFATSTCVLDLGTLSQRGHFTGSTLHLRLITTTPSSASVGVKVHRDSILILDTTVTAPTSLTNQSVSVSDAALQSAANSGNGIYVSLTDQAAASGTRNIYSVWLEVPKQNSVYISSAWLSLPPRSIAAIAAFEIETPTSISTAQDNKGYIYAGDLDSIWLVGEDFSFTDVSISGGYFNGDTPKAWRWAQWGNDVIATNYADPVQIRTAATGDFDDMITSTKQPRARDVIVVLDFVMLLNTAGEAEAGPDVIWWSGVDDATDFDPNLTTQSDYMALRDTPGQITCGVGGEYGIVFKQNAIYKINFVGAPFTFSRFLLSRDVGTEYPFSVVPVGRDIYFFDGVRFQVIKNGQEVIPLPSNLNKFLTDIKHEDYALIHEGFADMSKEDIVIQGQYDPDTHCIFWMIKTSGSLDVLQDTYSYSFHNVIVCYNTDDGRFSIVGGVDESTILSSTLLCLRSYGRNQSNILKSMILFDYVSAKTFSSQDKRSLLVESSVFSVDDSSVNIQSVRPIYTIDAEPLSAALANTGITISVESCDNHAMIGSQTVSSVTQSDEGWYSLRNSGTFHKISFSMEEPVNTLRELLGFEILYTIEGNR